MHWAKNQRRARYALSSSEVPGFRMDSQPIGIADLELDGASHHRYLPLRAAIAGRYGVQPENVVTADGTSMANMLAMATLIAPGDEVLFEQPAYEPMLSAASFLGAKLRRFERKPQEAFRLDPAQVEAAMTDRTRLIALTNLHNPSSALATAAELRGVGRLATAAGARVLVDEVYLDSATPQQSTAALLGPEFVATSSLTKVYGLSGLRCGWILAEAELAERMWRLNELFGVAQAHPAERLSCIAFSHFEALVGDNPEMLAHNRELFNRFVTARPDLECTPSKHGITAFPRWSGGNAERLDNLLRSKYDTSIVPGRWFELPDRFRIGFGLPADDFVEALKRLGAGLDDLR
jgi:aspartate/methionine/tyrosine aminotransferase